MSGRAVQRPPRFAGWVLRRALPLRDRAAWVGDLNEEFLRFALADRGPVRARAWYWLQVIGSLPRAVRRRFGDRDPLGSRASEPRPPRALDALRQDLRAAFRSLRSEPTTSALAVTTLALGIGANAAIFSLVNAVVLRPLPYADPDALVRFWPDALFYLGVGDLAMLDDRAEQLYDISAYGRTLATFTGTDAEVVRGATVSPNHFDLLGVRSLHGRTFTADEGAPGRERAIVLRHGFWQRRFGGDPALVGSMVELRGEPWRVIGVMPPEHVPIEFDWQYWIPLDVDPDRDRGNPLAAVARLQPGVDGARAADETRELLVERWRSLGSAVDSASVAGLVSQPIAEWIYGDWRSRVLMLQGAVGFVLVIAAANVANLLLARGTRRRRELAVRAALGAGRARIVRLLLAESILLSALGAILGLGLAALLVRVGSTALVSHFPRATGVTIDGGVLAFTAAVAVSTAVIFGAVPALRAARTDLARVIGGGGRGASAGRHEIRANDAFVALQVALALVLITAAGLMLRSFWALQSVDPGFRAEGVVSVRPAPPSNRYPAEADVAAYHATVQETLAALPGVRAVGAIMFLPMRPGGYTSRFRPADRPVDDGPIGQTSLRIVTPGYFRAMEVPILAGRTFAGSDTAEALPVIVINESLARAAWPDGEALGQRLVLGGQEYEVVGLVADVRQVELSTPGGPEGYFPYAQAPWRNLYFTVRVQDDPDDAVPMIRDAIRGIDPMVPINDLAPVGEVVGATTSGTRLLTSLIGSFGALALGLGMIGVYGVTSYVVARGRRDIGIRMAMGAASGRIVRETLTRRLRPVVVGSVVGAVGALLASRLLEGALYGVGALDPLTFIAAPPLLLLAAVVAVAVPARATTRVDPVNALRAD